MPQLRAAAGLYRAEPAEPHRDLLATGYAIFEEGFATPDLTEAAALLGLPRPTDS